MDNSFDLEINYKNKDLRFPASYVGTGYSYKIEVDVYGRIISYEPDEERNFRALLSYDDTEETHSIDKQLVEAIAHQLILLFK